MGPALFDTALVVISRVRTGRPIYLGATDHTSHRLLRLGLGTGRVVLMLAGASVVSTSLGVAVGRGWVSPVPTLVLDLSLAAVLLTGLLRVPAGAGADTDQAPARTA
jgi:UDP-GlcNAc:undecaprenyl-phosphate GlcNAc-1-phosphate transferase